MASTASEMLKRAAADVGYKEGRDNDTKHGRWYGLNYNPWCDMAVSMWADLSGNADIVGKFAYCPSHVNFFKAKGQWLGKNVAVKPGDIVFYSWDGGPLADHVGVVEKASAAGEDIHTIEGNTSSGNAGSQGNGDGCYRRTRPRTYVLGFGRPAYKAETVVTKPCVSLAHILEARTKDIPAPTGHTTHKADVLLVENALRAEGLLAAKWCDGSWGTYTQTAYDRFRTNVLKLTGDDAIGAPGKMSLTELGKRHGFTVVA
ncbi:CHAP domain-containing protein [Streptomyces sennicomposti]